MEPKVMQVLVALSSPIGVTLSRDDLIERCWEGRVVGDTSINRVVSLLRAALSKVADGEVTLENVPKVGYFLRRDPEAEPQFEDVSHAESALADTSAPQPSRRFFPFSRVAAAGMAAVLALAVAAAAFWIQGAASSLPTLRIAMLPIEAEDGVDPFHARGMAEEVRSALGRQAGLEVTSGSSTAQLIEEGLEPAQIGERLQADLVWSGRLSSDADRIGLDATLIDVESGDIVWSDTIAGAPDGSETIPLRSARLVMDALNRPVRAVAESERLQPQDYRLFVIAKGSLRARDQRRMP